MVVGLLLLGCVGGPVATAPGTYHDWGGDVDELEVVRTFDLSEFDGVVVGEWATEDTPLPPPDDNTYEAVQAVLLTGIVDPLVAGMREELDGIPVSARTGGAEERVLVVRGAVEEMDPGSRAARFWAGYGAGSARTRLRGEIVDSQGETVLLRFRQERVHGTGFAGGDYVDVMQENLLQIGRDLGLVLSAFR